MSQNFSQYRRKDGSIDLVAMWEDVTPGTFTRDQEDCAKMFLRTIEDVIRIRSRQVAALSLANATMLIMIMDPEWGKR